jgi:hypothetical protein
MLRMLGKLMGPRDLTLGAHMRPISRRKFITTGIAATAGLAGVTAATRLGQRYGLIPSDHGGIYGPAKR